MCATPRKNDKVERKELPDGSIVCWPREYGHLEEPSKPSKGSTAAKQRVVAALRECQRATPYSEYAGGLPNLTGRYEGPKSLCCINQAGFYLVVWWKYVEADLRGWKYGADYDPQTGLFVLHTFDDPATPVADLIVVASGGTPEIRFYWYPSVAPGPDDVLVRYSPRATLSDRALDALRAVLPAKPHPVVKGFIDNEQKPLAPSEVEKLESFLKSNAVERDLRTLLRNKATHTAESWGKVLKDIQPITRTLYEHFRDDLPPQDQNPADGLKHNPKWEVSMQPRVRYHAQEVIHGHSVTLKVGEDAEEQTATLYEWFQRGLYLNEKGTGGNPNRRFNDAVRNWLGVSTTGGYAYDVEVDLDGVVAEATIPGGKWIGDKLKRFSDKLPSDAAKRIGKWLEDTVQLNAGFRGLTGTMTVKSRGLAANWEATYWVLLALAGGGTGGGEIDAKYLRGTGTAESDLEWTPAHFVGGFTILSGEAARDKKGKLAENQLIWLVEGSHPSEPSIQLVLDKVDTDLASNDVGVGWGNIFDPSTVEDAPPPPPPKPKVYSYSAPYAREGAAHFALGSATVREEGRRILRILAANELVALRDRSCRVTFDGFADRLGGTGYNDVLSEMRAENAKTALLDCLDPTTAASMIVHGFGERPLEFLNLLFDFPDNSPSPEWRRVFVWLHGVASVELLVRDLKDLE